MMIILRLLLLITLQLIAGSKLNLEIPVEDLSAKLQLTDIENETVMKRSSSLNPRYYQGKVSTHLICL